MVEISRVHQARRVACHTDRNPIVKNVHCPVAEASHRKVGRRARRVNAQYPDRALSNFAGGSVPLLLHRLLGNDVDRCRRLEHRKIKPACTGRDLVERCHRNPREPLQRRRSVLMAGLAWRRRLGAGLLGSRVRLQVRCRHVDWRKLPLIFRPLPPLRRWLGNAGIRGKQRDGRERRCRDENRTDRRNTTGAVEATPRNSTVGTHGDTSGNTPCGTSPRPWCPAHPTKDDWSSTTGTPRPTALAYDHG